MKSKAVYKTFHINSDNYAAHLIDQDPSMRFILICSPCAAYNDMWLQTQSIHTQTLLPNPCNLCHVSFGQQ